MKYIAIDVTTLGDDAQTCHPIEFAAMVDDLETPLVELPKFHCYLIPRNRVFHGTAEKLIAHSETLKKIQYNWKLCWEMDERSPYPLSSIFWSFSNEWIPQQGFKSDLSDCCIALENIASKLPFMNGLFSNNSNIFDPSWFYFNPYKDNKLNEITLGSHIDPVTPALSKVKCMIERTRKFFESRYSEKTLDEAKAYVLLCTKK
jgi:hypothetical protein